MEQKVGGTRMGRSAEGQLVKGPGPSQRGATSNHVERGSRQRGRGRPQKTRPPTSVPFPSTYTFSSPHVVSPGQCVGAQKRKHQECREIRARGSWAQPNGAQTMSSIIPATLWSREVQSARENRHKNLSFAPWPEWLRQQRRIGERETFGDGRKE